MPTVKSFHRASLITILTAFIAACSNYDFSNRIAVLPTAVVQVNTALEIPSGEAREGKPNCRRSWEG